MSLSCALTGTLVHLQKDFHHLPLNAVAKVGSPNSRKFALQKFFCAVSLRSFVNCQTETHKSCLPAPAQPWFSGGPNGSKDATLHLDILELIFLVTIGKDSRTFRDKEGSNALVENLKMKTVLIYIHVLNFADL